VPHVYGIALRVRVVQWQFDSFAAHPSVRLAFLPSDAKVDSVVERIAGASRGGLTTIA